MEFIIVIILIIIFMVISFIVYKKEERRNDSLLPEPHKAKLIQMQGLAPFGSNGMRGAGFNFSTTRKVVFQLLSTGKKKEFTIDLTEYYKLENYNKGDEGILILQGTRYISFKRDLAESS